MDELQLPPGTQKFTWANIKRRARQGTPATNTRQKDAPELKDIHMDFLREVPYELFGRLACGDTSEEVARKVLLHYNVTKQAIIAIEAILPLVSDECAKSMRGGEDEDDPFYDADPAQDVIEYLRDALSAFVDEGIGEQRFEQQRLSFVLNLLKKRQEMNKKITGGME